MELLCPMIQYKHLQQPQTIVRFLNGKNTNNKVSRWGLEVVTYNITFTWISGARYKAADCVTRLVKLPNDSKATVMMLTATNLGRPTSNTRNKTSQQCQTTKDTRPSNTPSITKPAASHLTTVETTQDITPKPLTADRCKALL